MAVTTATRQQSVAIRNRMREIRSELPYDVDDARARVKQLSDWKYHVSRRPIAIAAAAAVVGYLLVARPPPLSWSSRTAPGRSTHLLKRACSLVSLAPLRLSWSVKLSGLRRIRSSVLSPPAKAFLLPAPNTRPGHDCAYDGTRRRFVPPPACC